MLLEGSVKVHLFGPEGAEVIPALLGPGAVVAEMGLADSLGRSTSVTTLGESAFLRMDRITFHSTVATSPALANNLAEILSKLLRLTNAHLLSLATPDMPGRVASKILALCREYGKQTPEGVRMPIRPPSPTWPCWSGRLGSGSANP